MEDFEVVAKEATSLLALCQDRGLPTTFCDADIEEIKTSSIDPSEKSKILRRIKASLHELLYAPPGRT